VTSIEGQAYCPYSFFPSSLKAAKRSTIVASAENNLLKANTNGITDLQFGFSGQINPDPSGISEGISDVIIK